MPKSAYRTPTHKSARAASKYTMERVHVWIWEDATQTRHQVESQREHEVSNPFVHQYAAFLRRRMLEL